jgi:hypothetical protein
MKLKIIFSFLLFFTVNSNVFSQSLLSDLFEITWDGLTDHPFLLTSKNRNDTTKWIIDNKYRISLFGNSTYVALASTFSNSKEYEISVGRTKGILTNYGRGMGYSNLGTWGLSFFSKDNLKGNNIGSKIFLEYNHRPAWILGSFVLRTDYSYNFTTKHQYLTPSAGISIVFLDLLYNYSFPLNLQTDKNYYKSGFTLRLKYILGRGRWEFNKPKNCGC